MRQFLALLILAALVYLAQPLAVSQHAWAATDQTNEDASALNDDPKGTQTERELKTSDGNGGKQTCSTLPEAKGGVLLGHIIPCLIFTIEKSTESFSEQFIHFMEPIFYAFLTLAIVFFGVKVLQGEREIGPQAFSFVVKIAFVIGMLQLIPHHVVPKAYGVMADGVQIVSNAIGPNSSSFHCDINKYGDANTPQIWKQMDCVLGKLFGFATGTGNTGPNGTKPVNMILVASTFGLLSGFFFGGTLGVAVFFAMIGVLWTILMLVFRTALAFMNGYLIVCLMLIMAPLFLPLVLLKTTSDYFEKWWKAIFAGLLLPIIIAAYAMYALLVYDKLLFAPDSKMQKLFDAPILKEALQQNKKPCSLNITGDPKSKGSGGTSTDADLKKQLENPYLQRLGQPLLSGGSDACSMLSTPTFDVTKVNSSGFQDKKKAMTDLFMESIKLFLMAYLIAEGLKGVQGSVSSMIGSSIAGAALTANSPIETKFTTAFERGKAALTEKFVDRDAAGRVTSTAKDKEFINRAPGAFKSGIHDYLGEISTAVPKTPPPTPTAKK